MMLWKNILVQTSLKNTRTLVLKSLEKTVTVEIEERVHSHELSLTSISESQNFSSIMLLIPLPLPSCPTCLPGTFRFPASRTQQSSPFSSCASCYPRVQELAVLSLSEPRVTICSVLSL